MKALRVILLGVVFLIATGFNLQHPTNGNTPNPNSDNPYSEDLNLAVALYTMWDLNHNRTLEKWEWEKALNIYADSELANELQFTSMDKNDNSSLDINEFRTGLPVLNNQQLEAIFNEDPARITEVNRLEIWDTDDDPQVEKLVAGDLEIVYDVDNN